MGEGAIRGRDGRGAARRRSDGGKQHPRRGEREADRIHPGRVGKNHAEQIDAEEMAAWLDTISYEVLCSPSKRVPRVYINA